MSLFHIIKQDQAPKIVKLITEISRGDFVKYEFNHEYGILEVDRVLYGPVFYPVVYADMPGTWNVHDGDPLDAVIYTSGNIIPGAMVYGRVIGLLEMIDDGEIDHKIVCVNDRDPRYKHVNHVNDLSEYERKDLVTFMETYKYAQKGPDAVKIPGFQGPDEAYKFIEECQQEYIKIFGDMSDDSGCECGGDCGCGSHN